MSEKWDEVAEGLSGTVGHDDCVVSTSHSRPAVSFRRRQIIVALPPQHLETERHLCEPQQDAKNSGLTQLAVVFLTMLEGFQLCVSVYQGKKSLRIFLDNRLVVFFTLTY